MIQTAISEPAEANGRRTDGRFGPGNSFGRGNPTAKHAQRLRQLFVTAVTEDDVRAIVAKLVELAKGGDIQAANLLLTRALGKPSTSDNTLPLDDLPKGSESDEPVKVTAENLDLMKGRLRRRIALLSRADH